MTKEDREQLKNDLKESLTIEQVFDLVAELGGEPRMEKSESCFVSKTICHNEIGEGSYKLYYYENTHLFRCYTECNEAFDIYELVRKVKIIAGFEFSLPQAMHYVANYFGIKIFESNFEDPQEKLPDWEIFSKYNKRNSEIKNKQTVELKIYDKKILAYLPHPRILPWEGEGITREIMEARGICYNPVSQGIIIPHYDINNRLVGIRERTLITENEVFGKYRPSYLNNQLYNHPLSFNLYNLNNSKDNIKQIRKVIVYEGEKSCLLYASLFGKENDITVASCGSSLINYQVDLLLSLGVEEIIVGYDKQFKEIGDLEWKKWTNKLKDINNKYCNKCQISFLFDTKNLLGYKMSPIDNGKDVFLELFKERIIL